MGDRFKPAASLERQHMDWGIFAQVSGPRDGLAGIVAVEGDIPGQASATTSTGIPARRR